MLAEPDWTTQGVLIPRPKGSFLCVACWRWLRADPLTHLEGHRRVVIYGINRGDHHRKAIRGAGWRRY